MQVQNDIMFVDGDYWVKPDFCEAPYQIAEKNGADLVAFGSKRINRNGEIVGQLAFHKENLISEKRCTD